MNLKTDFHQAGEEHLALSCRIPRRDVEGCCCPSGFVDGAVDGATQTNVERIHNKFSESQIDVVRKTRRGHVDHWKIG